jgi:hypothetical protein
MDNYAVSNFEFNDLLCNGNLKQLENICDLILEKNLEIRWSSYAAINAGMSLDLCRKMFAAGCRGLCYGLESGSDTILKKMNKKYTAQNAETVIRNTFKSGIHTGINIIIGFPGETEPEFRETCDFVRRNVEYIDEVTNVSTCFIMPESDLGKNLTQYGVCFPANTECDPNCKSRYDDAGGDGSSYYALPDNTPLKRAQRLRTFLSLLSRLNVTNVIVNYETDANQEMPQFIEKLELNPKRIIHQDAWLDISQRGKLKLFFKEKEITSAVGLNTSFYIDGLWIDSSFGKWKIKETNNKLKLNLAWPNIPLTQSWKIIFEHNRTLLWEIKTNFKDAIRVHQIKIGLLLSCKYDKYHVTQRDYTFPENFDRHWKDLFASACEKIELTPSSELPKIAIDGKIDNKAYLQLQNSSSELKSRMVNFCLLPHDRKSGYNAVGQTFKFGDVAAGQLRLRLS